MNKKLWNISDLEKSTHGFNHGDNWSSDKICIDSRIIEEGNLFIALKGENFDGHDFLSQAFEKGAAGAIVDHIPDNCKDMNLFVVEDTYNALIDMAKYHRNRFKGKIIAVTGSMGKTSTKEMLSCTYNKIGKTYSSKGNFNNHYGLPLCLVNMALDNEFGIFELGMSAKGEIEFLSCLIKPDIAIITIVAAVHLQYFNSVKDIALAKSEIFLGLKDNSTAILNKDDKYYDILLKEAKKNHENINIVTFGQNEEADVKLVDAKLDKFYQVIANIDNENVEYNLNVGSIDQVKNSLIILATLKSLNLNIKKSIEGLEDFQLLPGRGKLYNIKKNSGEYVLVDDSYNASPESVKSALNNLSQFGGRKLVFLGDMYELGQDEIKFHKDLLFDLKKNNIDKVFTVGKLTKDLYNILPDNMKGTHKNNSSDMAGIINEYIKSGDRVLIKGSRGVKMDNLVEKLLKEEKN